MSSGPRVSVVIPTWNRAHVVPRAVASALSQLEDGDEVIVVDDGSRDATEAALAPFRDRIRYLRFENAGVGPARNRGIDAARHPYVAFLDSDDVWLPNRLALGRGLLDRLPDAVFVFSDLQAVREGGERVHRVISRNVRDPRCSAGPFDLSWGRILSPGVPYSSLAPLPPGVADFPVHVGDLFPASLEVFLVQVNTLLVNRERAGDSFRYSTDLPIGEDWECVARLAQRGPCAYLDCETALFAVHREGPRVSDADDLRLYSSRLTISRRLWGEDPAFLAKHRARYGEVLGYLHAGRARALIREGRRRDAREDLRLARDLGPVWRALSHVPGPVVRGLVRARRWLRSHAPGAMARRNPAG